MTKLKVLEEKWSETAKHLTFVRTELRKLENAHALAMKANTEAKQAYIYEFHRANGLEAEDE